MSSMVNTLGRACLFDKAERLIRSMLMGPDVFVTWSMSVNLGEKVAQMEHQNHAFLYAKSGRLDDHKMEEHELSKSVPGDSMIKVGGVLFEFSSRDHPKCQWKPCRTC